MDSSEPNDPYRGYELFFSFSFVFERRLYSLKIYTSDYLEKYKALVTVCIQTTFDNP